jgi:hypothetical protein
LGRRVVSETMSDTEFIALPLIQVLLLLYQHVALWYSLAHSRGP